MGNKNKIFAVLLIAFCLAPIVALQPHNSKAQSLSQNSAPAIEWQHRYGQWNIQYASNLIQTNDSGFVFMDTGWHYQVTLKPATIYKLDASGNTQWTKTIDSFIGDVIIQTIDGGYEITGEWSTREGDAYTPTLIKTDFQGNIQWVQNYSRLPSIGIPSWMNTIQTSDGGFVHWSLGQITKTGSSNSTQWVENFTYISADAPPLHGITGLPIGWVIETSDGALALLGVGQNLLDNARTGNIYLYKTEPFLPTPASIQLPTPIPTPTPSVPEIPYCIVGVVGLMVALLFVSGLIIHFKNFGGRFLRLCQKNNAPRRALKGYTLTF